MFVNECICVCVFFLVVEPSFINASYIQNLDPIVIACVGLRKREASNGALIQIIPFSGYIYVGVCVLRGIHFENKNVSDSVCCILN